MGRNQGNQTEASVNRLKRFNDYIAVYAAKSQSNLLGKPSRNYFSDTTYVCEICGAIPAKEHVNNEFFCKVHYPTKW